MTIELAPSILSANFARLGEDAKAALDGGGTVLHCDVMDGHFVPNITIGPLVVASLRKALPNAILDCHLMIEHADEFIPAFAEAGASWISVHQEACVHLHRTLQQIESHGCKSGVVLNPATPVHMVDEVLDMARKNSFPALSRRSRLSQKSANRSACRSASKWMAAWRLIRWAILCARAPNCSLPAMPSSAKATFEKTRKSYWKRRAPQHLPAPE